MNTDDAKVYARQRRAAALSKIEWMQWQNVLARLVSTRAVDKIAAVMECEKHKKEEQDARHYDAESAN